MIPKESPLSIAAYHGNVEMVDLLKKHELLLPHHFPQAFREAAGAGDLPMLRKLWTLCGENHACLHESESERCRRRCTPLHVAAAAGHLTCVQHLCVDDYLRKTQDCVGDLPLNYAIENGHLVITAACLWRLNASCFDAHSTVHRPPLCTSAYVEGEFECGFDLHNGLPGQPVVRLVFFLARRV
ncbi:unnamed protein product [Heligmosomoides polygyrus]|uniref:ANK_REP_REGION domain-containing protein n=1 Tax=Heligmosomoides polygyrus TaxID=6339 RepID=A0A183F9B3_HELPZ|nr:unnamed protein product [Heligmosomoides polygyrus]